MHGQKDIKGIVLDDRNIPIEHALVMCIDSRDSSILLTELTDGSGYFSLKGISETNICLQVQMLGFEDYYQNLAHIDLSDTLSLRLQPSDFFIEEIEISATRSSVKGELGKKVLRVGSDLIVSGISTIEALNQFPFVQVTARDEVIIRGGSNVIYYIDGIATTRDSKSIANIPLETIERFEVITNPSSEYGAEGVSGIINIIRKKSQGQKVKIGTNISYDTNERLRIGLNSSIHSSKVDIEANMTYGSSQYASRSYTNRNNHSIVDVISTVFLSDLVGRSFAPRMEFGVNYSPLKTIEIEANVRGHIWDDREMTAASSKIVYLNSELNENNHLAQMGNYYEKEYDSKFSIVKSFSEKQKLTLSSTHGGEWEKNESFQSNNLINNIDVLQLSRSYNQEYQNFSFYTLDYIDELKGSWSFQLGAKYDDVDYNISQEQVFTNETLIENENELTIEKFALYASSTIDYGRLQTKLGLRFESYSSELRIISTEDDILYSDQKIFPSLQSTYKLTDLINLEMSYSKRINRPGYHRLNPFVSYNDALNLESGNPYLQPSTGDNFEASLYWTMDRVSVTSSYFVKNITNVIQSSTVVLDNNRTLETYANYDNLTQSGIEMFVEYNYGIVKASVGFMQYSSKFHDPLQLINYNENSTWRINSRQRINLPYGLVFMADQSYKAPRYGPQIEISGYLLMNASISKKLHNRRGSIGFSITDILDKKSYLYTFRTEDFDLEKNSKWQTRAIRLRVMYNFVST